MRSCLISGLPQDCKYPLPPSHAWEGVDEASDGHVLLLEGPGLFFFQGGTLSTTATVGGSFSRWRGIAYRRAGFHRVHV